MLRRPDILQSIATLLLAVTALVGGFGRGLHALLPTGCSCTSDFSWVMAPRWDLGPADATETSAFQQTAPGPARPEAEWSSPCLLCQSLSQYRSAELETRCELVTLPGLGFWLPPFRLADPKGLRACFFPRGPPVHRPV